VDSNPHLFGDCYLNTDTACPSLNYRKKKKAELSKLIPRKLTANPELLIIPLQVTFVEILVDRFKIAYRKRNHHII